MYFYLFMDIIMSIIFKSPPEVAQHIAKQVQAARLALNFSQKTLAERSGLSYGTLKKFERTGEISLTSLIKIALSLGCLEQFQNLFPTKKPEQLLSLDALLHTQKRQRGRI